MGASWGGVVRTSAKYTGNWPGPILLRRSANVFVDISSVPPKNLLTYFPWIERVAGQAMFGSDWPGPGVKDLSSNAEDFYDLPLSDPTKRQILRDTALTLFGDQP